jgi:hypothetical protein
MKLTGDAAIDSNMAGSTSLCILIRKNLNWQLLSGSLFTPAAWLTKNQVSIEGNPALLKSGFYIEFNLSLLS